jgi:hypothetical protein
MFSHEWDDDHSDNLEFRRQCLVYCSTDKSDGIMEGGEVKQMNVECSEMLLRPVVPSAKLDHPIVC